MKPSQSHSQSHSHTPPPPAADLRVDVEAVLRSRAPSVARRLPGFIIRSLEKFVCQKQMNEMLEATAGLRDADFCAGILERLGVTYTIIGAENLPPMSDRRVTLASNHPLGGLDGIILIDMVTRLYGPGARFIVNDLLMALKPLHGVFLPINKHGAQSRAAAAAVDAAFADNNPVLIFPAGLCSRRGADGVVRDLRWNKMFVTKSIESGRTVIPIRFGGCNSGFFYNFAKWRERLGIKFNIEMIRLPKELFRAAGSSFTITIGKPIPPSSLQGGAAATACAQRIKETVYSL
ncbi:MAG: glycerol acyltransferase [Muribaculaceae bacterium]|nr:glycerol acyltransferase [Muribaculaceae bacterium]